MQHHPLAATAARNSSKFQRHVAAACGCSWLRLQIEAAYYRTALCCCSSIMLQHHIATSCCGSTAAITDATAGYIQQQVWLQHPVVTALPHHATTNCESSHHPDVATASSCARMMQLQITATSCSKISGGSQQPVAAASVATGV